jgi:hypothetical protein
MAGSFGDGLWPLTPVELTFPPTPDRFRYFARFLLEGTVFQKLKQFVPHLKNKPNILNKPWSKSRIVALLQSVLAVYTCFGSPAIPTDLVELELQHACSIKLRYVGGDGVQFERYWWW